MIIEKRKKRETTLKSSTGEETPKPKKGPHKTVSSQTGTANFYKTILNRVADTCLIYMESSVQEQNTVSAESRFYYVKEIVDTLDQDEKASFLEYLRHKDEHFLYNTFHSQNQRIIKDRRLKENIKAFKVENKVHSEEKEHIRTYTYRNMDKSKKSVKAFLEIPDNGPRLHEIILRFLDRDNPDYKWYINLKEDERAIGKIVQKEPRRGKIQDTRNVMKNHVELAKKRFRALDRQLKR